MTHHLVGVAEAARILGVTRQRIAQLAVTDTFPSPEVVLSGGRIWRRHDIESWAAAHPERGQGRAADEAGWALHRLQVLAAEEATALGHGHLGCEHMMLAMLRPECPGVARQVLESFGVRHDAVRARIVKKSGPPDPDVTGQLVTPRLLVTLERAKLEAERLADPVVTSEHVLLATSDGDGAHWTLGPDVTAVAVRERVVALTDSGTRFEAPDPDFLRRKEKSMQVAEAKGTHHPGTYLVRSDRVAPEDRRPWGSMLIAGEPWRRPGMPTQYWVDRDGVPVLGPTGRPVGPLVDGEDYPVLDDDQFVSDIEFDIPEDGFVQWPEGFEPPPGAHPSVVAAHRRRPR